MRFFKMIVAGLSLAVSATALAQTPSYKNVGETPASAEIAAWNISIGPDGKGLPTGSGTSKQGAPIFEAKCAVCHGESGEGGKIGTQLVASRADYESLKTMKPVRAVADYYPYATMIWDYIHRAMPRHNGGTLSPDEVYALTAFILARSNIIQDNDVMNAKTLPKVQMPNRNGFVPASFADVANLKKRGCTQGICP
ncbi:MAG: c-type cytochrome [Candidatus Acidiferrales bacterium]